MMFDITIRVDCGDLDVQDIIDAMWNALEPLVVSVIDAEAEEVVE